LLAVVWKFRTVLLFLKARVFVNLVLLVVVSRLLLKIDEADINVFDVVYVVEREG